MMASTVKNGNDRLRKGNRHRRNDGRLKIKVRLKRNQIKMSNWGSFLSSILLLAEGRTAYMGSTADVIPYFDRQVYINILSRIRSRKETHPSQRNLENEVSLLWS